MSCNGTFCPKIPGPVRVESYWNVVPASLYSFLLGIKARFHKNYDVWINNQAYVSESLVRIEITRQVKQPFITCHLNFFHVYGTNLKKIQLTNWKKFWSNEKKFRYAGPEIFLRFETDLNFSRPWFPEIKVQIKWPNEYQKILTHPSYFQILQIFYCPKLFYVLEKVQGQ